MVSGLVHGDRSYGVISIAVPEGVSLDAEELDLFGEVVDDIAFALYGIEMEEKRKRLQAQIAQSDRLATIGILAAGVAHEINNPLTYILYNLESLTDDLPRLTSALRKCLEIMTSGVDH